MRRRDFLITLAATATAPALAGASSPNPNKMNLRAEPVSSQLLPEDEGLTALWGYNGSSPGPEIRARQGEELSILFQNRLDQASAVHWHGIRLPNAMDGVPYMTQAPVNPGEDFQYTYRPQDAGTYWYHSHSRSWEQVARGLYGPLIVEETDPPDVDHDITVILDDWRLTEDGQISETFENRHDQAHAGRLGNWALAIPNLAGSLAPDMRVRLRFINVATARLFPLVLEGIAGKIVALDGMPVEKPYGFDSIVLAPAQRVDVIGDVVATDEGAVRFLFPTREEALELGRIGVSGPARGKARGEIPTLPPNPVTRADPRSARRLTLRMEGGAMGARRMEGGIWAFNGVSELGDDPLGRFDVGETGEITLINETRFPHGIHLHGHHFYELEDDGSPGALRDTTLIAPNQSRKILCVFDNPGKWLMHCHMLDHQAAGMKTWIEVG